MPTRYRYRSCRYRSHRPLVPLPVPVTARPVPLPARYRSRAGQHSPGTGAVPVPYRSPPARYRCPPNRYRYRSRTAHRPPVPGQRVALSRRRGGRRRPADLEARRWHRRVGRSPCGPPGSHLGITITISYSPLTVRRPVGSVGCQLGGHVGAGAELDTQLEPWVGVKTKTLTSPQCYSYGGRPSASATVPSVAGRPASAQPDSRCPDNHVGQIVVRQPGPQRRGGHPAPIPFQQITAGSSTRDRGAHRPAGAPCPAAYRVDGPARQAHPVDRGTAVASPCPRTGRVRCRQGVSPAGRPVGVRFGLPALPLIGLVVRLVVGFSTTPNQAPGTAQPGWSAAMTAAGLSPPTNLEVLPRGGEGGDKDASTRLR